MAATPPTIIDHPSLYGVDRDGQAVVAIVMHGTAGTDSLAYLTQNPRSVSTHYLIPRDGNTIYRMVHESRGANHAGAPSSSFSLHGKTYTGSAINRVTIGVELESMQTGRNDYTDSQLLAMGWLINDIRARHHQIPVLRHGDLDPSRRRDPVGLTREQIEKWANAAVLVYAPPLPVTKRYRVRRVMISQPSTGGPPYAGELFPGEEVAVDKWYSTGMVHLADGRGFVQLSDLEAI